MVPNRHPRAQLVRNALRPAYFPDAVRKMYERARHPVAGEGPAATRWAQAHAVDLDAWARTIDASLWEEAQDFKERISREAAPRLDELAEQGVRLGGAGAVDLLYFLVRLNRPVAVLETGVAAGWSTWAILAALEVNGQGLLWSNDLPYLRLADAERYVGCLVPESLTHRWTLSIGGDRKNLPRVVEGRSFDLVHYDSDKTRSGRQYAMRLLREHLAADATVVMDDIGDDFFFRDWAPHGVVFESGGKHVGLVGSGSV